jgi:hypothetical protein
MLDIAYVYNMRVDTYMLDMCLQHKGGHLHVVCAVCLSRPATVPIGEKRLQDCKLFILWHSIRILHRHFSLS